MYFWLHSRIAETKEHRPIEFRSHGVSIEVVNDYIFRGRWLSKILASEKSLTFGRSSIIRSDLGIGKANIVLIRGTVRIKREWIVILRICIFCIKQL